MADGMSPTNPNAMLIQYLAAAGQDIGSGNPLGTNTNAVTNQNLAAQSQATTNQKTLQMLQQMLAGKMSPGSSMKMSDKGDLNISLNGSALGQQPSLLNSQQPVQQPSINQPINQNIGGNVLNPFL